MTVHLASAPIGTAELQQLLSDADPAALLVQPRLLRRVIKQDCRLSGVGLQVPHRKSYTIGLESLLAIADRTDLGVTKARAFPARVILLACSEEWLGTRPRAQALVRIWRLLFHARIDLAIENLIADGKLTDAGIRAVLHRVGFVESEEAFRVLRHENFLLPPDTLQTRFTEFVALFFELRYFARPLAARYFPAIEDLSRAESIFGELFDVQAVFEKSRLAGAPDPVLDAHDDDHEAPEYEGEVLPAPRGLPDASKCQKILARADRVSQRGNVVRAAILGLRAADVATPELLETARQEAMTELDRLVKRLQAALELHDREADEWLSALRALLGPASHGIWPPSARLLYDLQKVCVDHERDLYALDMVEWGASLFRKPIKRPVPLQADVLLVKHLRSAASRLGRARISDEDRRRLAILLRSAIRHCEERLREKIRPILAESLEEVGILAENEPEKLSLRKIVEELLDRVTERGFLNLGDIRDAVSRNQLKLADVTAKEILLGDRLLKANRKLSLRLDGVYRRGEIYLRWLQRFSSLLFGTVLGRWLTLYFLLPFGGAFALIVFWDEMVHLSHACVKLVAGPSAEDLASETNIATAREDAKRAENDIQARKTALDKARVQARERFEETLETGDERLLMEAEAAEELANQAEDDLHSAQEAATAAALAAEEAKVAPKKHPPPSLWALGGWGVFLFLMMHAPSIRRRVWEGTKGVWKGLRIVIVEAPQAFIGLPPIRRILESQAVLFVRRQLMFPLLLALVAVIVCGLFKIPGPFVEFAAFGITFLVTVLFFSSRLGRRAEEAVTDWLARNWYWLRVEAVRGMIGWLIWFFKELMDRIERVLYTVDEWLRFRPGDSRIALFYKPILGLIWFFLTYVIRIVINLMIEPTVNPVKHFPAVTVGAKLIIPMIPAWSLALTGVFKPILGIWLAGTIAGTLIILIPGVFGFAAWELKENWRLYRANRRRNLGPVMIGHHGETMLRFMRPGFHSGTLPKLYAKIRRAERRGDGRKIHKQYEALHHVTESLRRFAARELLFLLEQSRSWGGLRLLVGDLKASSNRVRIELRCPDLDETGLWLMFEERSGWLMACVQKPGWLGKLNAAQRTCFSAALAGLYKKAGVALIREQVEMCLPPGRPPFTLDEQGIMLFAGGDFSTQEVIPLVEQPLRSTSTGAETNGQASTQLDRLLYTRCEIAWDEWVAAWDGDHLGQTLNLPVLQALRLLPPTTLVEESPGGRPVGVTSGPSPRQTT